MQHVGLLSAGPMHKSDGYLSTYLCYKIISVGFGTRVESQDGLRDAGVDKNTVQTYFSFRTSNATIS